MIKIKKKTKDFAKEIHKKEHSFVEGRLEADHKLEEYYYLMASYIFHGLIEKIEESNTEVYNLVVDLTKEVNSLKESMKEVAKQQKYLWQTLKENEVEKKKQEDEE